MPNFESAPRPDETFTQWFADGSSYTILPNSDTALVTNPDGTVREVNISEDK